jgi:hypothetical protein
MKKCGSRGLNSAHLHAVWRVGGMVHIRGVPAELFQHFAGLEAVHARQAVI